MSKRKPPIHDCLIISPFFMALTLLAGCSERNAESKGLTFPPVPVSVATVVKRTIPVEVRTIGSVEAYSTVTVKSRIDGELEHVHFKEGQDVHEADLLFQIDPRPFELALKRAEANLAKDMFQAQQARLEADRSAKLLAEGVTSKEQNELNQANANAMDAAVRADKAAVENSRVQLEFCTIRSPLDGRTGRLMVHEGNLVKENETVLVVIHRLAPIYVNFSVGEKHLARINQQRKYAGSLKVEAILPGEPPTHEEGILTFVDNTVDTTAGTISLKGTFENKEKVLWPGQFVDVALRLDEEAGATVVPAEAVQTGQQSPYVYIVRPDLTAELRPIAPGRTIEGLTVVEQGLEAGETVVTDGHLRLVPGARVVVKGSSEAARSSPQPEPGS